MPPNERFLAIDDLMKRGFALDAKLMPARVSLLQVSLSDAQSYQVAYMTWAADCLPLLDADLQRLFTAAHLGTDDRPGTQRLLELLVQACDSDPVIAEPAATIIRPQFWHAPLGDRLGKHLEILETARRRAFRATHAIPPEITEIIAAAQKRRLTGSIDELFVASGCERHWWVRPLAPYRLDSARHVHGWFTAIQVHAPEREIAIVRAVILAVLRTARLNPAKREALQRHLEVLQFPAPPRPVPRAPGGVRTEAPPPVSCFISYSSTDQALAERLYTDLQAHGVRCWYAPHDLEIGEPIVRGIDEAIRRQDAVLLLLSEASVLSGWVEHEVLLTLTRERAEGRTLLVPLRLDDTVMQMTTGWAADLRARHIGDFRGWQEDDAYQQVFGRLLRDLQRVRHPG
jgi:hypothetical protein